MDGSSLRISSSLALISRSPSRTTTGNPSAAAVGAAVSWVRYIDDT